jgi:hypothetical protein
MKSYADTGFLVSLYLNESTTAVASAVFQTVSPPVPLIPLGFLELRNAFHLATFHKQITVKTRQVAWAQFETDVRNGIYVSATIAESDLFGKAAELSEKYSASVGTRSLDLLHVTAALLLQADEFLSFDTRQCVAAKAERLQVRP